MYFKGGQSILNLIDHYGVSFNLFILAIFEMITFSYIYGVNRVCKDVEFMLGYRPGIFWRITWWFVTPVVMTAIVIYSFVKYENPKDNANEFPAIAHVIGWCFIAVGLIWLPLLLVLKVLKKQKDKKTIREVSIHFFLITSINLYIFSLSLEIKRSIPPNTTLGTSK